MSISYAIRLVVAVGIVIGGIVIAPASHATSFPGENGLIAYTKVHKDVPSVWTIYADGSHKKLLALNGHFPVWSPNGRSLAFVSNNALQVIAADGSGRRSLTTKLPGSDHTPQWSYDGKKIAFVNEQRESGRVRSAIIAVDVKTARFTNVSGWSSGVAGFRSPSWKPDGTELVYEQYGDGLNAVVVSSVSSYPQHVLINTSGDVTTSHVAWSPTGKKILYSESPNEVYTIWADGTHRAVVSDGDSYDASWSPTGNGMTFIEDPREGTITIGDAHGNLRWLSVALQGYEKISHPVLSPDGKMVLYELSREKGNKKAIVSIAADGSGGSRLLVEGSILDSSWQAR